MNLFEFISFASFAFNTFQTILIFHIENRFRLIDEGNKRLLQSFEVHLPNISIFFCHKIPLAAALFDPCKSTEITFPLSVEALKLQLIDSQLENTDFSIDRAATWWTIEFLFTHKQSFALQPKRVSNQSD